MQLGSSNRMSLRRKDTYKHRWVKAAATSVLKHRELTRGHKVSVFHARTYEVQLLPSNGLLVPCAVPHGVAVPSNSELVLVMICVLALKSKYRG